MSSSQSLPPTPVAKSGSGLVLLPAGAEWPAALLDALASRGLPSEVVYDEPSVMAALGEQRAVRRVLVVVAPPYWERLAELICAVHTYHSDVLCWQYAQRQGKDGQLTHLDGQVSGPESGAALSSLGLDDIDTGPIGQIHTRRRPIDDLVVKVADSVVSTREVVTRAELNMLLGPLTGETG